ncbi:C40 family peptidase [Geothrix oryzisoli]|uniref:C40 family peptidase n=1 Tax=Geothrix oryzisoli TaxID=2922721 RepID=UPI001FAC423E|nr:C40 family peptidase [Geothrix oryzisoli]
MNSVFLRGLLTGLVALAAALPGWGKAPAAYVVLRPVINFHSGPQEDRDVVSQAVLGARLVELDHQDGWIKVKGEDDYPGWVQASTLRPLVEDERYPASLEPGKAVEIDALGANLYLEPDVTKHAPVLTAPYGVRLERINGGKDTQRWLEVRLPDRRAAWIQSGDVRTDLQPLSLEASLALAKRFLGITYTWGGSSTFGFDCSGFTQTILRSRGVIMPRDANIQAEWPGLVAVTFRTQLQPGDLLFFGKDAAHITHTGMYLGKGAFIHDTPKDRPGIQISGLGDPYWSKLLVAMRRLK